MLLLTHCHSLERNSILDNTSVTKELISLLRQVLDLIVRMVLTYKLPLISLILVSILQKSEILLNLSGLQLVVDATFRTLDSLKGFLTALLQLQHIVLSIYEAALAANCVAALQHYRQPRLVFNEASAERTLLLASHL